MIEHQVIIYQEGLAGTILGGLTFGIIAGSKINPVRFTEFLNSYGADGWGVVAMTTEIRRTLLVFRRESVVVILRRARSV